MMEAAPFKGIAALFLKRHICMKDKALVILSSGLDSAVNLAWAVHQYEVTLAVTFDYGQKAAAREIHQASLLCRYYGLSHLVISLPFLAPWSTTALVNHDKPLPLLSETDLNDTAKTRLSAEAVWVPNRNGIFIQVAAALSESRNIPYLVVGFNQEEGTTFPDNSIDFLVAANRSLFYSTLNHVEVLCHTIKMAKEEIVREGIRMSLPFELIWSCYETGEKMCGLCESCVRLKRAVTKEDPKLLEVLAFAN